MWVIFTHFKLWIAVARHNLINFIISFLSFISFILFVLFILFISFISFVFHLYGATIQSQSTSTTHLKSKELLLFVPLHYIINVTGWIGIWGNLDGDPAASTRRWTNVVLMLGQSRRRWPSIKTTLVQRLLLAGMLFVCRTAGSQGHRNPAGSWRWQSFQLHLVSSINLLMTI